MREFFSKVFHIERSGENKEKGLKESKPSSHIEQISSEIREDITEGTRVRSHSQKARIPFKSLNNPFSASQEFLPGSPINSRIQIATIPGLRFNRSKFGITFVACLIEVLNKRYPLLDEKMNWTEKDSKNVIKILSDRIPELKNIFFHKYVESHNSKEHYYNVKEDIGIKSKSADVNILDFVSYELNDQMENIIACIIEKFQVKSKETNSNFAAENIHIEPAFEEVLNLIYNISDGIAATFEHDNIIFAINCSIISDCSNIKLDSNGKAKNQYISFLEKLKDYKELGNENCRFLSDLHFSSKVQFKLILKYPYMLTLKDKNLFTELVHILSSYDLSDDSNYSDPELNSKLAEIEYKQIKDFCLPALDSIFVPYILTLKTKDNIFKYLKQTKFEGQDTRFTEYQSIREDMNTNSRIYSQGFVQNISINKIMEELQNQIKQTYNYSPSSAVVL